MKRSRFSEEQIIAILLAIGSIRTLYAVLSGCISGLT